MKYKLLLTTSVLLAFALTGCKLLTGEADQVVVGAEGDGSTIRLSVGDELVVELEGNPTTGYEWQVAEVDETILVPRGEPDYQSESELVGAGGIFTFRFEAVGLGETNLQLIYHRPWEEDTDPLESFTVIVVVEGE